MKATAAAIRGRVMGWGKLQRRGLNDFPEEKSDCPVAGSNDRNTKTL